MAEAALSLGWVSRLTWGQNKYQPCVMETNWGAVVETKSASDPASLMSRAPDFIGLCEPGKMDLTAYRRSVERLSTRRGLLYMAGTFENTAPWLEQMWKQWKRWPNQWNAKAFSSPTYTNRIVYPNGVHDLEFQRLKNETLFAQDPGQESAGWDDFLRRLVGVPAASPEIIFSKIFKPREHVGNVEWVPKNAHGDYLPVFAAVDPGYSGNSRYVVLSIQIIGKTIRVFDEVVAQYTTHEQMKKLCSTREWWPHMHSGTIDPYAGESHVYGANVTPGEAWRDERSSGRVVLASPQRLANTEEEIRLAATYFTGINGWTVEIANRCERLRWELASWKRKKIQSVLGEPEKKGNDAIKALIYFMTHHRNGLIMEQSRQFEAVSSYNLTGPSMDPVLMLENEAQLMRVEQDVWGSGEASWLGVGS